MTIMKLNSRAKTLVDSQKASLDDLLTVVACTTENGGVHVNKPYDFLKKWERGGDKDTDVKKHHHARGGACRCYEAGCRVRWGTHVVGAYRRHRQACFGCG